MTIPGPTASGRAPGELGGVGARGSQGGRRGRRVSGRGLGLPLLFISAARSPFGESAENPIMLISAQDPGPAQFSWILGKPGTPIGEKFDPGISGKPEAPVDTLSSPIDSMFDPVTGKHKQHTHIVFGTVISWPGDVVLDPQQDGNIDR